uniref:Uncharacterized protein n=1 Tax=Anguilla anguilla TaxID=7936 RepID=A0A0E9VTE9_ANGAN
MYPKVKCFTCISSMLTYKWIAHKTLSCVRCCG